MRFARLAVAVGVCLAVDLAVDVAVTVGGDIVVDVIDAAAVAAHWSVPLADTVADVAGVLENRARRSSHARTPCQSRHAPLRALVMVAPASVSQYHGRT